MLITVDQLKIIDFIKLKKNWLLQIFQSLDIWGKKLHVWSASVIKQLTVMATDVNHNVSLPQSV